jgi:tripartite-type tricarboxylate transporter receptor subunit TctC
MRLTKLAAGNEIKGGEDMTNIQKRTLFARCAVIAALMLAGVQPTVAQERPFYEGKTVEFIVGYNPGGGTDLLARIFMRHFADHIEGQPNIVVRNLPGGGGIAAANVVFNQSRPDGLTFALPGRSNYINAPVLGNAAVQYDLMKFEWIGAFGDDYNVLIVSNDSGLRSFEDLVNANDRVLFGAWSRSNQAYVIPTALKSLAPNIHPVTGYGGAGDVILALERREVHAAVLPNSTMLASLGPQVEAGEYFIIAQRGGPETEGVVQIQEILSPEYFELVSFVAPAVGPTLLAPPGTNPEALQILRDAFVETVQAPAFIEEMVANSISLSPMNWEETTDFIETNLATSDETLRGFRALSD